VSTTSQPSAAAGAAAPSSGQTRTPAQIEAEIEQTRQDLAGAIDTLQDRLSPAGVAQALKDKAMGALRRPDGSLDPVRTSAVVGVALILVLYLIRRRGA
jgi:type VI protein secretion system component VasF